MKFRIESSGLLEQGFFSGNDVVMPNGGSAVQFHDLATLRTAIPLLEEIPALADAVRAIALHPAITQTLSNTVLVNTTDGGSALRNRIHLLIHKTALLDSILNVAVQAEAPHSIVVQFSDPGTLGAFSEKIRELEKFFDIVAQLKTEENGSFPPPRITAFDTGSFWIEAVLGTAAAVTIVGMIVDTAYRMMTKYHQMMVDSIQRNMIILQQKDRQAADELASVLRSQLADHFAKILFERGISKGQAEAINIMRSAILECSKLIQSGMSIFPALNASTSVKDMFPSDKVRQQLPPEATGKLEANVTSSSADPKTKASSN